MKIKAYTINAFAKTENGGNPAGVVLNADQLNEEQMKKIAKTIGFSETAFVMKSNHADFKVRFFTPNEEVDLCGHATIATFSVLARTNCIMSGKYTQETKAGVLEVTVNEDNSIMMTQSNPIFYEILDYKEIASTLNIDVHELDLMYPCQIVSTGLKDILIPIRTKEALEMIKPNFAAVAELSKKYGVVGYHMFVINDNNDIKAYCRNLAPLYGIDEEAATGTSNGALACYLYKYGVVDSGSCDNVIFSQGDSMNAPSEIIVSLSVDVDKLSGVKVGGKALQMDTIEVSI